MIEALRIAPGKRVDLKDHPADAKLGCEKASALKQIAKLQPRLEELGGLIGATRKHAVVALFQGMDASGKDGAVAHCIGPLNPGIVGVTSFKAPTATELGHDFLWRVHQACPAKGSFGVFNRSHYEDVLVVRVENLVPEDQWERRYAAINAFERNLVDEGTIVLKFFLNMSHEEQAIQLQQRIDDPTKHWKFNVEDLKKREKWDEYMNAYRVMLERTSTEWAPWYVVPSDRKWVRNLVITKVMVNALEKLKMTWPELPPGDRGIKIV
jgi:PPK2 family polyphosphate:nucleotide phosphotransferase